MAVAYNGLWEKLIEKEIKKVDLINNLGISSSIVAKMIKGRPVSLAGRERICKKLGCDFGDIICRIDQEKEDGREGEYA